MGLIGPPKSHPEVIDFTIVFYRELLPVMVAGPLIKQVLVSKSFLDRSFLLNSDGDGFKICLRPAINMYCFIYKMHL